MIKFLQNLKIVVNKANIANFKNANFSHFKSYFRINLQVIKLLIKRAIIAYISYGFQFRKQIQSTRISETLYRIISQHQEKRYVWEGTLEIAVNGLLFCIREQFLRICILKYLLCTNYINTQRASQHVRLDDYGVSSKMGQLRTTLNQMVGRQLRGPTN